jgi:hypothetical protein
MSSIDTTNINTQFPIPGQDNDSQGFRTNFSQIVNAFDQAKIEIDNLNSYKADLVSQNIFYNTTPSESTYTGAVIIYGGVGIGGQLYIEDTSYIGNSEIITTATVVPVTSSTTDIVISGTFGQPKYVMTSTIGGNKYFTGTVSIGVLHPNPLKTTFYAVNVATTQTVAHLRSKYADGTALKLDTHRDTPYDFVYIDFLKSPAGEETSIGQITSDGATILYGGTSDYRLKEDVQPMVDAIATMMRLRPVTYTWIGIGKRDNGYIAHELADVLPNAVVGEKDAVDENGKIKAQQVDTRHVVPTLNAAMQEQQRIIESLIARIEALENRA